MTSQTQTRPPIRFRGRSFLAVVLAPEAPIEDWLADLDALAKRSPAFFAGRAVILDVTTLAPSPDALKELVAALNQRDIPIMGIEGAGGGSLGPGMPPPLNGGRPSGEVAMPEDGPAAAPAAEKATGAKSLMLESPVRSGQAILFPEGDVTVMGSVASGAEIIAGGSIHIYGALRGRAIAGAAGTPGARIFCRRFEPELLAIDGLYRIADDIDPSLRGRAVQVWLDGDAMRTAALD
ncbi:septum site-determining protein MinC [Methylobacterium nonmethylotrophicum]|uniref:Probable septum site-determining protein MinC n=1 Tax=Methylobacterium nonmethylotrophicum TaxID=1141884 RepID=A0A4Z0NGN6_9HYPH|nr:septum site-determining protein MinC [Methylobacterium nonmethylotrophicum]TGD94795.1 septum formation inhibitor MinC [Methylobacterium nonmethylotrophicum]